MIDERKDKLGEQSEEQVNIQELLFRYLIHICCTNKYYSVNQKLTLCFLINR